MDEEEVKRLLESIDYEDLKVLRKESNRKLSNIRRRDRVFFTIYLQKEYVENFELARDWAFAKGLIKKRTRWAFTKFAITNVIDMVIKEKENEWINTENEELARRNASTNPFDPGRVRQDKVII
ncbi:MAG: hypothetical protein ABH833_00305 [Parcubacteria group bacterium]